MATTKEMLAALENIKPVRTFLKNTFFRGVETHITPSFQIDIVRGGRRLPPFVSPIRQGKVVDKEGFETFEITPAYIKPKMVNTAQEVFERMPGEMIFGSNETPATRANKMLIKELADLSDMITRREEWMCSKALFTGETRIKGEGVDRLVDFRMLDSHKIELAGNARWSDPTNSAPVTNLRNWSKLASKDGGKSTNIAIFGSTALDQFLSNTKEVRGVNSLFDKTKIELGQLDPAALPEGVTYWGRIKDVNLDIYTYDEWYVDDIEDGVEEGRMVPDNYVLLGSTQARCTMHYGPIQDLKAKINAAVTRFPKIWEEEDPSVEYVMVQSAPLPVPHEIDSFVSVKVS